jgi:hypothetical protein
VKDAPNFLGDATYTDGLTWTGVGQSAAFSLAIDQFPGLAGPAAYVRGRWLVEVAKTPPGSGGGGPGLNRMSPVPTDPRFCPVALLTIANGVTGGGDRCVPAPYLESLSMGDYLLRVEGPTDCGMAVTYSTDDFDWLSAGEIPADSQCSGVPVYRGGSIARFGSSVAMIVYLPDEHTLVVEVARPSFGPF